MHDICLYERQHSGKRLKAIALINNYLPVIIKRDIKNVGILAITYKVVTILENVYEKIMKMSTIISHRILNAIMIEVNKYRLQYCAWRKFNFLLHNNINLIRLGNGNLIKRSI